ncbi:MAG: hypothetical protein GY937_13170 [bacterium]|nr:hypothetical protein [bacterium]
MQSSSRRTRYTRAVLIAIASLGLCVGGLAEGTFSPDQVEGPFTWGSVSNVTHLSHLWFAGQPDQAGIEKAKAEGIAVVINLRDPSEHAWDEKSAVEALGMTYYNVPVRGVPFDKAAFAEIETLVKQHHGEEILVHCASSNRVGGWLATHLVGSHGMSADEAIAVGRRAGITKEPIAEAVRAFVGP